MPKVLLVADASWVVNEVRSALSLGHWNIEVVTDPRVTTELTSELEPHSVIVDMQVGSMGGMAVIRGIRGEIDASSWPRLVLLLDRKVDEFIARRAGADACVLKPINAAELRTALGPVSESDDEEPSRPERSKPLKKKPTAS